MQLSGKRLVQVTLLMLLALGSIEHFFNAENKLHAQAINTQGSPLLGDPNAPVQMVIFEDLRCGSCHEFHMEILPEIKKRFIDTGKVQCSLLLLAFLDNSEPLAVEALARFEENPDSFFSFVEKIYTQPAQVNSSRALASRERLKAKLDANEHLASKLMNDEVATPTVFIDGKMSTSYALGSLISQIEHILAERGE
jgi:protein-disulfide isomerase